MDKLYISQHVALPYTSDLMWLLTTADTNALTEDLLMLYTHKIVSGTIDLSELENAITQQVIDTIVDGYMLSDSYKSRIADAVYGYLPEMYSLLKATDSIGGDCELLAVNFYKSEFRLIINQWWR